MPIVDGLRHEMNRRDHIDEFYAILSLSRDKSGYRRLAQCSSRLHSPRRGLYFFFTEAVFREDGQSLRVIRVGTHAVSEGSKMSGTATYATRAIPTVWRSLLPGLEARTCSHLMTAVYGFAGDNSSGCHVIVAIAVEAN